eukprot:12688869-Ditylum_brightwellii.AAC.1
MSREAFSIPLHGMTPIGNMICPFIFLHPVAAFLPPLPDATPCTTPALEGGEQEILLMNSDYVEGHLVLPLGGTTSSGGKEAKEE